MKARKVDNGLGLRLEQLYWLLIYAELVLTPQSLDMIFPTFIRAANTILYGGVKVTEYLQDIQNLSEDLPTSKGRMGQNSLYVAQV